MNMDELRNRSSLEAKLATSYVLKVLEESGEQGIAIAKLVEQVSKIREVLRGKNVALRFGYRNHLADFLRWLYLRNLITLEMEGEKPHVTCRISESGKSELEENPPEKVLGHLVA